jgi:hypothetical protein
VGAAVYEPMVVVSEVVKRWSWRLLAYKEHFLLDEGKSGSHLFIHMRH